MKTKAKKTTAKKTKVKKATPKKVVDKKVVDKKVVPKKSFRKILVTGSNQDPTPVAEVMDVLIQSALFAHKRIDSLEERMALLEGFPAGTRPCTSSSDKPATYATNKQKRRDNFGSKADAKPMTVASMDEEDILDLHPMNASEKKPLKVGNAILLTSHRVSDTAASNWVESIKQSREAKTKKQQARFVWKLAKESWDTVYSCFGDPSFDKLFATEKEAAADAENSCISKYKVCEVTREFWDTLAKKNAKKPKKGKK